MAYTLSQKHSKKRAFITGAGGGLGRGLSLALAKDGWTIGITDLKEEALAESKKLIEAAGGKAHTYQFDVSKREDYKKHLTTMFRKLVVWTCSSITQV